MHASPARSQAASAVDENLTCTKCDQDEREDDDILLCDGDCERGWHLSCLGMTAIPPGDWLCTDCLTLQLCRMYLRQQGLHRPSTWLTVEQLPFKVGALVAAIYPARAPQQAQMHFGSVVSIGAGSGASLSVRMRHWPYSAAGYPNFEAAPNGHEWEEEQLYWPLLQYAGIMVAHRDGTVHLSAADQQRLYSLSEEFRVS